MTTARSRAKYHHGDLKRVLLAGARALIAEKGLEGFTIRELARRVDVTHGAAYRHFEDKTALLAEIAKCGYADLHRQIEGATSAANGLREWLTAIARAYVQYALSHPAEYQVMFGPRLNATGQFPELEPLIEGLFDGLDQPFVKFAGCDPRRAREHSVSVLTTLHGLCEMIRMQRIRVRSRAKAADYAARLLEPFISGVESEAAGD